MIDTNLGIVEMIRGRFEVRLEKMAEIPQGPSGPAGSDIAFSAEGRRPYQRKNR
jgi:hypothetical protein